MGSLEARGRTDIVVPVDAQVGVIGQTALEDVEAKVGARPDVGGQSLTQRAS